jgi:hypothetical protein
VKKAKQIGKVNPKPTIQASSIEPSIHQGVMTLDHHEPFAFEAIHPPPFETDWLSNSIHDQGDAARQQPAPEDSGTKRHITAMGMRPIKEIAHPALYHQHREGEQSSDRKPPRKGSHTDSRRSRSRGRAFAPDGHSSRGFWSCQADGRFIRPSICSCIPHALHRASEAEGRPDFKPRWRKTETVPFPLSAVTRPGSSASFVVT